MLLQRLATGATSVKQARYRRRPTRGSEALLRACAQRNHIKPLRCGHPSIKARGSFPNGGHYRGVPLYYLAGEYMECSVCYGTFISWDNRMLQQLTVDVRSRFPAVLTRKYGCDVAVVGLLRARTLGNSPTALCHNLHEVHSEEWMRKQLSYLGDCERHRYVTRTLYNVRTCADVHMCTSTL